MWEKTNVETRFDNNLKKSW